MGFKIIIFDMDGVIFRQRNLWMLVHEKFGTLEKGKILTEKYLHTDYEKLVEEVVYKLWKGRDAKPYFDLIKEINYLEGVKPVFDYIHSKRYKTAIVSGASIDLAQRVQKDFGVDYIFANELIIKDGKLTGEFRIVTGQGTHKKAEIILNLCKDICINPKEAIYIGDSKQDIEAFKEVGLSIAFNSDSEELKKVATIIVNSDNLVDVLPILKENE